MPDKKTLWSGKYKIPWDDPDFSRRMLKEHLSQDHDLASRKQETIEAQVQWVHENLCDSTPSRLLDIGCGPGLYMGPFLKLGYDCCGIDFSPASIEHAHSHFGDKAHFIKDDIRSVDFGSGYDAAMMLFGELNVFSPKECRQVLRKVYNALAPGGKLLLELHTFDAVKRIGETPGSWYRSGTGLTGLFSDKPYICLIENRWFEREQTALQQFHVVDAESGTVTSYRSTTRAWSDEEYQELLIKAGFSDVIPHYDFTMGSDDFVFISAVKTP